MFKFGHSYDDSKLKCQSGVKFFLEARIFTWASKIELQQVFPTCNTLSSAGSGNSYFTSAVQY